MKRPAQAVAAFALLLAVGVAAGAGGRVLRYSGRVALVDLGEGLVVLDELAARGHHRRHQLYVAPETAIVTVGRLRPWHGFEELPVTLADLVTGDFVVVESTEAGGRLLALRITIVESRRHERP